MLPISIFGDIFLSIKTLISGQITMKINKTFLLGFVLMSMLRSLRIIQKMPSKKSVKSKELQQVAAKLPFPHERILTQFSSTSGHQSGKFFRRLFRRIRRRTRPFRRRISRGFRHFRRQTRPFRRRLGHHLRRGLRHGFRLSIRYLQKRYLGRLYRQSELHSTLLRIKDFKILAKFANKSWKSVLTNATELNKWISNYKPNNSQICRPQNCGNHFKCWIGETFCMVNKLKEMANTMKGLSDSQKQGTLDTFAKNLVKGAGKYKSKLHSILKHFIKTL